MELKLSEMPVTFISPHKDVRNRITLRPVPARIIAQAAVSHLSLALLATSSELAETNIRTFMAMAIIVKIFLIVLLQSWNQESSLPSLPRVQKEVHM